MDTNNQLKGTCQTTYQVMLSDIDIDNEDNVTVRIDEKALKSQVNELSNLKKKPRKKYRVCNDKHHHYSADPIRNLDDIEKIKKLLENADNENLRLKSDLIREFLDKAIIDVKQNENIDIVFDNFIENKKQDEIVEFSSEVEVSNKDIKEYITEYEYSGLIDTSSIKDVVKGGLLRKRKISERIKSFIIDHVRKFSF